MYIHKTKILLKTYPANKAISMPLTVQSRYIILHNWPVTATAFRCKHIKIIIPAIWFAIPLMKSFLTKLFPTLGTEKMFSVPCFFECSYAFLKQVKVLDKQHINNVPYLYYIC